MNRHAFSLLLRPGEGASSKVQHRSDLFDLGFQDSTDLKGMFGPAGLI